VSNSVKSLAEALPLEMARVRDEVMPAYQEIGAPGRFAIAMMRAELDRATDATVRGDIAEMIRTYESLKAYTL
jgi:hypothetical protein